MNAGDRNGRTETVSDTHGRPVDRATRLKLPIGIQTFRQIREGGFYYVDKTGFARRLADDAGKHYFLSRPRRFGKSLFVDTLKELFEGSEELFRGLAVHDGWNWSKRFPVVRLSFGSGNFKRPGELLACVTEQLADLETESGVPASEGASAPGRFARLLAALHRKTGARVVVLVDEYDKPILDAMEAPELANANRDDLRGLYGTLKDYDAHVEMSFITGVSRFSKVSLLSDLNNLTDITLNALAPHWRSAGDRGALRRSLAAQDWCGVETLFRKLLAGIPHDWHRRNEIARYEGYWSSVFYAWFQASMDSVAVEDATSRGRLDMAVLLAGNAYLFEFKVAEHSGPGTALAQLRARRYADKYRASTRAVHLIGVEISGDSRDIMVFETESA